MIEAVAVAGVHPAHRRRRRAHASKTCGACSTRAPTRSASTPPAVPIPQLVREASQHRRRAVHRGRDRRQAAARAARGRSSPTAGATPTGLDAVEWAREMAGRRRRRDPAHQHGPRRHARRLRPRLTRAVSDAVGVPVIASGGVGTLEHLADGMLEGRRRRGARRQHLPLRRVTRCGEAKRFMQHRIRAVADHRR